MILKFLFIFLCFFGMFFSVCSQAQSFIFPFMQNKDSLLLIVNMDNHKILPRNFRMAEEISFFEEPALESEISIHGLSDLRASASGQFSEEGLNKILETIPTNEIFIVDLREESHGFINGIAVSWYGENDWGNKNKALKEIQEDEKARLQKVMNDKTIHLFQKNNQGQPSHRIHVKEIFTEEDLIKRKGLQYERIPITDHLRPTDEKIDYFVTLMKNFISASSAEKSWVHFHCTAGRGRSTTFISMYDMMCNAGHVSFRDILARQALIGGKDLTEPFDETDWRYFHHFERLQFLANFYNYCLKNPHFEQPWSTWINTN